MLLPLQYHVYVMAFVGLGSTFSDQKVSLAKTGIARPTQGQFGHGTLRYVAKSNRENGFLSFLFSIPFKNYCLSKNCVFQIRRRRISFRRFNIWPVSRATEVDGRRTAYQQNC